MEELCAVLAESGLPGNGTSSWRTSINVWRPLLTVICWRRLINATINLSEASSQPDRERVYSYRVCSLHYRPFKMHYNDQHRHAPTASHVMGGSWILPRSCVPYSSR